MPGKSYELKTTLRHTFRLGYCMTLSFILNDKGQVDGDYPIYTLESTDGSYSLKLSAGSDLVAAGDYMQLRFDKLLPGLNYKLTRLIEEDMEEVIFDDVPFGDIVDQERDIHAILEDHGYGELSIDTDSEVEALCFEPDDGNGSNQDGSSASSDSASAGEVSVSGDSSSESQDG